MKGIIFAYCVLIFIENHIIGIYALIVLKFVHSSFLYSNTALIIQNDLKPPTKGLSKGDNSQNKLKANGNNISEVSKSIINSLKLTSKRNLPSFESSTC